MNKFPNCPETSTSACYCMHNKISCWICNNVLIFVPAVLFRVEKNIFLMSLKNAHIFETTFVKDIQSKKFLLLHTFHGNILGNNEECLVELIQVWRPCSHTLFSVQSTIFGEIQLRALSWFALCVCHFLTRPRILEDPAVTNLFSTCLMSWGVASEFFR